MPEPEIKYTLELTESQVQYVVNMLYVDIQVLLEQRQMPTDTLLKAYGDITRQTGMRQTIIDESDMAAYQN